MKPLRKLRLHRESLHELTNEDLAMVVGGAEVSLISCPTGCCTYGCTHACPSTGRPTDDCTYRTLCDPHK